MIVANTIYLSELSKIVPEIVLDLEGASRNFVDGRRLRVLQRCIQRLWLRREVARKALRLGRRRHENDLDIRRVPLLQHLDQQQTEVGLLVALVHFVQDDVRVVVHVTLTDEDLAQHARRAVQQSCVLVGVTFQTNLKKSSTQT